MRRFFFGLLILLIAFRGVIGDAMAYEMTFGMAQPAKASLHATQLIASRANSMPANELFSSKKATEMPCHQSVDDTAADSENHACNACMVCHSPVLQRDAAVISSAQLVMAYAAKPLGRWVSAELERHQKPPVS